MKPYFDYSDIENPIKYHVDDSNYLIINFGAAFMMDLYIRKNEYTLYDSIFGSNGDESDVFYSLDKTKVVPFLSDQVRLALINFRIDDQIDQYERTVQTVFEVVGTIGGNYEILRI